jgi:phospholipase/carboxylesterase
MTHDNDELLDAITAVMPPILTALETLAYVGRHLHPPNIATIVDEVADRVTPVRGGLETWRAFAWPEYLQRFADQVGQVGDHVCAAYDGLTEATLDENGVFKAYRAMGHSTRAVEALYPIASMLPSVSRFYIEAGLRDDPELNDRLENADSSRDNVGIIHAGNEKGTRGGFSMYVPEYYDESRAHPLIMALHGGSGHGRDFLWTWLKEARSRGAILVSPTSKGATWALGGPDVDSPNLDRILKHVRDNWNIDASKLLLTGMSDGGTFTYVSGLRGPSPLTHLAPSSASFHLQLIEGCPGERIQDLPVYLMHGALDWMFPVDMARIAKQALTDAGANVVYREIDDLSHTYPRDENPRIMDWFLHDRVPDPA